VTDHATRVTLRDIAERVGLTPAAVSMALAGNPRISDKTRSAVREAATELGYVPSSAGRALRRRHAGAIALVVPNTTHHVFGHLYFMHVLTGVSSVANGHDAQLLVATNADEADGITAYERVLRSQSADGAIVTSAAIGDPNVERLTTSGLPVVLIGSFPEFPAAASVWIDDVSASRQVTEHVIREHGRRRIAHVTGPLDHRTGVDRREGFLAATRDAGLADARVVEGDFSEESGAAAVEELLASGPVDGIVFANDDMAFGGMRALQAAGVDVPRDVSLVGFDDFEWANLFEPRLTLVEQPCVDLGRQAAALLIERMAAPTGPRRSVRLPTLLNVRASCRSVG